ncbi:hypothetical protein CASFOL_020109 [Castilleja foliolosa]|uniref:Transposase n=1 Tax=Castilleja foliolosa TaxID=1961234 RepID=A0ABD3D0Q9_9LAMI
MTTRMTRRPARASQLQDIDYLARDHNLPRCWVVGNELILMPDNIPSIITKIFKKDIHRDGVNWKAVPGHHKKKYFEMFKDHFSWAPSAGPAVCTAFMKKAATRYRDMIARFKKGSPEKPECVSDATWEKWLEFWSRPEVMEKSEKASRNRNSEKAGPGTGSSRHAGGSRSAYSHSLVLEQELGHPPDAFDCMLHMHTRKDGTIIDEQARIIAAAVEERAREAREAAGDGDIDMTEIYCQVVPVVKQRLFGLGSKGADFVNAAREARPAPVDEVRLRQRVRQELRQQFTAQMAAEDARRQEQLDAHRREMEQQLQAMRRQIVEEMHRQGLMLSPPGPEA